MDQIDPMHKKQTTEMLLNFWKSDFIKTFVTHVKLSLDCRYNLFETPVTKLYQCDANDLKVMITHPKVVFCQNITLPSF